MFIRLEETSTNRKVASSVKHIGTAQRLERAAIHNDRTIRRIRNDLISMLCFITICGSSEISSCFSKNNAFSAADQFTAIHDKAASTVNVCGRTPNLVPCITVIPRCLKLHILFTAQLFPMSILLAVSNPVFLGFTGNNATVIYDQRAVYIENISFRG